MSVFNNDSIYNNVLQNVIIPTVWDEFEDQFIFNKAFPINRDLTARAGELILKDPKFQQFYDTAGANSRTIPQEITKGKKKILYQTESNPLSEFIDPYDTRNGFQMTAQELADLELEARKDLIMAQMIWLERRANQIMFNPTIFNNITSLIAWSNSSTCTPIKDLTSRVLDIHKKGRSKTRGTKLRAIFGLDAYARFCQSNEVLNANVIQNRVINEQNMLTITAQGELSFLDEIFVARATFENGNPNNPTESRQLIIDSNKVWIGYVQTESNGKYVRGATAGIYLNNTDGEIVTIDTKEHARKGCYSLEAWIDACLLPVDTAQAVTLTV